MIDFSKYLEKDVSNMDRDVAVLIYKGKVYYDVNHQYALEEALSEDGTSMGIDLTEDIDSAADVTHCMSRNNEISTLDIYCDGSDTRYLMSHFEEQLTLNWDIIKEITIKEGLILGTHPEDFHSHICKVFVEQPYAAS